MSMTRFLEVNGSLRSGSRERWFRLPSGNPSLHSLRFGHHALVANGTMQIVPLGDTRRLDEAVRPEPEPARASRIAGMLSKSKWLSFLM